MVSTWRGSFILSGMLVWSHLLLSSAITEEQRLTEAISNFSITSFELKSNIKLTKELPPLKLLSGQTRVLRIFSRGRGFSLSGAKKFRGIFTPNGLASSAQYPVATLTIENLRLIDFDIKISRQQPTTPGPARGSAVGVEKTLLTITNSTVSGAIFTSIFVGGGTLLVKNSKLSKTNSDNGGAISFVKGLALTIEDSEFTNNIGDNGGAVYVESSALIRVARTTFKGNRASTGGAFGVFFDRNVAPSTPPLFDSCTFDSNYAFFGTGAEPVAGAIVLNNVKEIRFTKSIFSNNYVPPLTNGLLSGAPNDVLVVTAPGDKTTIRVVSGVIGFIKGTSPNNFVVLSS
eukprot:TRINITY_DN20164_c0_g1_i1.p1 TRINITY_DN20164_c0_g1~~TRINITY_DN20164_c0_g1_i1.p1  ORF type:complete len:345 (-),score=48.41 TRINITY_DN20164_c0_g1_i1:579-1613(-)